MIYQILKPGDCVVPMFVEADSLKTHGDVIELIAIGKMVAAFSSRNVQSVIAMEALRAKRDEALLTGGTAKE